MRYEVQKNVLRNRQIVYGTMYTVQCIRYSTVQCVRQTVYLPCKMNSVQVLISVVCQACTLHRYKPLDIPCSVPTTSIDLPILRNTTKFSRISAINFLNCNYLISGFTADPDLSDTTGHMSSAPRPLSLLYPGEPQGLSVTSFIALTT